MECHHICVRCGLRLGSMGLFILHSCEPPPSPPIEPDLYRTGDGLTWWAMAQPDDVLGHVAVRAFGPESR